MDTTYTVPLPNGQDFLVKMVYTVSQARSIGVRRYELSLLRWYDAKHASLGFGSGFSLILGGCITSFCNFCCEFLNLTKKTILTLELDIRREELSYAHGRAIYQDTCCGVFRVALNHRSSTSYRLYNECEMDFSYVCNLRRVLCSSRCD